MRLTPPIWTMIFLALAAGASWLLNWPPIPWLPRHEAVGMALFFAAWIPILWAYALFRIGGTELDPVSETNRLLVTHGPYAFTRNPMYLGLTVAALGMAIWVGAWPMLLAPLAVFATANFAHIPFEEAKMRRQFGEAYDAYVRRVRRWL